MHCKPQHLLAADRNFLVNILAMVVQAVQDPIFVVSTHFNWAPLLYEKTSVLGSRCAGERAFRPGTVKYGGILTITGAVQKRLRLSAPRQRAGATYILPFENGSRLKDDAINSWNHRARIWSELPVVCKYHTLLAYIVVAVTLANSPMARAESENLPYGLSTRIAPAAYLRMPHLAGGKIPLLLSQTGAFSDTRNLVHSSGLIPYDIVVPFWSDGAAKSRWVAIPNAKIKYSPTGDWTFPKGTVFVKTFELPIDAATPGVKRRLETRLLVCDSAGGVYGVVYKWRPDLSEADLLRTSQTEEIPIKTAQGELRKQTWYYPSRPDCLACHNAKTSGVLGVKARQMNRTFTYPSGVTDNELRAWNHAGLFTPEVHDADLAKLPTLAAADDATRSIQDRARSYLDANCAQCHRPGGTVAYFDARYDTPIEQQGLIDGPVLIDQGIDKPRVISPHDIWRSIIFMRVNTVDDIKMPPVARETIDQKGVKLLQDWITSLPGRSVLDPPTMSPEGGTFSGPVEVSLSEREPGADIRYTLDGSVPGPSDMRYETPIKLTSPAVLRARAYKDGFTRSITTQEIFIIGK
jgi:uncharacterized repeat protein (TIGR03806 family)